MSEPRLISPLLDDFIMGDPISDHHGVCCCPAIKNGTEDKYIVKVISVPASSAQMDALLLTGAYPDEAAVLAYYKEVADDIIEEIDILKKLSEQEGFIPYESWQLEPMEDGKGYDIYLLRTYNRTLDRHFKRHVFTHLDALNLGLDLCAALSVSRRSGYLYVDLKPGNIFVTDQLQYRIGGLGFIRLDSLQYTSLPEKYRSVYTPAEISDAYSALNTTMDIYAAGLILYQAYNNGALPFGDDVLPGDKLPAPMYADYEMSQIILKACDPDPAARWQDPMQMGQAIVSYMQRNGAKDSPIVPLPTPDQESEEAELDAQVEPQETEAPDTAMLPEDASPAQMAQESIPQPAEEAEDKMPFVEDEYGNFFFLSDFSYDDLDIPEDSEGYEELTGEVTEILNQADELAALSVPEPVIVPDHIDLPELEPIETEAEEPVVEEETAETVSEKPEEKSEATENAIADVDDGKQDEADDIESLPAEKKKSHWLRNSILVLLVLALLAGGYCFYKQYYLLCIDSITLDGSESSLTVRISTDADDSLLEVICVDTYGNQIPARVIDGKAVFTDLVPNTAYSIKVVTSGFHKVVGSTTATYSTPMQTNIAQFDAITGVNDGSVILNFTVDGPDSKEWKVIYSADGEDARSAVLTAHRVTLNDLTVGKEYTFRLEPTEQLYLSGLEEIRFTAQRIVRAENLEIVSCMNNALVAKWSAPAGEDVSSWTVSCSGGTYNKTVTTTDTTVTFADLDNTAAYTVEVKANYMSVGEKVSIAANTATVTDLKADTSKAGTLEITWNASLPVPAEGWILHYSVAGIDNARTIACDRNEAVISSVIPNATYRIWLTNAKDEPLLSADLEVKTGGAADFYQKFDDFEIGRNDLAFQMCKTQSILDWDGENLEDVEFAETFATGEAASFLVKILQAYSATEDPVAVLYIIRNQNGTPVYTSTANSTWLEMWPQEYCKLNIPAMPTVAGSYTIEVYFNSGLAAAQAFTIA